MLSRYLSFKPAFTNPSAVDHPPSSVPAPTKPSPPATTSFSNVKRRVPGEQQQQEAATRASCFSGGFHYCYRRSSSFSGKPSFPSVLARYLESLEAGDPTCRCFLPFFAAVNSHARVLSRLACFRVFRRLLQTPATNTATGHRDHGGSGCWNLDLMFI